MTARLLAFLLVSLLVALGLLSAIRVDRELASASGGVLSIGVGSRHTCVVTQGGAAQCWGDNDQGQVGDGTTTDRFSPVDVCASGSGAGCEPLSGVVAVSTGYRHSCALMASGGAKCWGENNEGQLGDGTLEDHLAPADVCASGAGPACSGGQPLTDVEAVEAAALFSCALMADGGVKCWGNGDEGQLGAGPGVGEGLGLPVDVCSPAVVAVAHQAGAPCEPLTHFTSVTGGRSFACGTTTAGRVQCWGRNNRGQRGLGTGDEPEHPTDVCAIESAGQAGPSGLLCEPVTDMVDVQAGTMHVCALAGSGRVDCWGDNTGGALGDGTDAPLSRRPVSVCASGAGPACEDLEGIAQIAAGNNHTCAVTAEGRALCWGTNYQGGLGDGTIEDRANPVAVDGLDSGVGPLGGGPGSRHKCASGADGLRCWGYNLKGQLGIGSSDIEAHPSPLAVPGFGPKEPGSPTPTTPTPTETELPTATITPAQSGLLGDVDCSAEVNAVDAAFLLQFIAGLVDELPCGENEDANDDGSVNSIDVALILQVSAGLLGSLPP